VPWVAWSGCEIHIVNHGVGVYRPHVEADEAGSSSPDIQSLQVWRVKVHLIHESRVSLVDAGHRGSAGAIRRALEGRGRVLSDIARVICTHGHPDHAGGAGALAAGGAEILMHPADAAGLKAGFRDFLGRPSRGRFFAAMTPEPPAITPIEDGDVLPVLGGLTVIHTPGHTPGSVCLWSRRHGLLFVGDVLQRRFGRVGLASALYSDDIRAARRSVQRLAVLDVRTIVFSHFPPLTERAGETLERIAREAARR
jgi:glyoxylase-like metal-dependent hydrolase (beta-lactamase superfamily II)